MCALENGMKLQKRRVSSNSSVARFHWPSTHAGSDRRHSSTWSALATPAFRKLWIAGVVSGTCVAAHDTAAIWMMNVLTPSPFLISLVSTVASLPFFLFTLPAGALADLVDRKKLLCLVQLWLAGTAAGLAILGWSHLLNPYVILAFVFLIGVGFALNAPVWTSSVSELVSNADLPSAATLGGLQLNISGIIGPALGGLLVPLIGPNSVFAANAACFLVVCAVLERAFAPERADGEGRKRAAPKCLEPSPGLYAARRTDLPSREQRIAHAKAM